MQTAADLARVFPDSELAALLNEIDGILYSQGGESTDWSGKSLLETAGQIRKSARKKQSNMPALQELYK